MRLHLEPLGPQDLARVQHVRVAQEQEKFSGQVEEAFGSPEAGVDFHGIFEGAQAVGFFKIDRAYHTRMGFAFSDEIGLRAFLIDQSRQGQGLGQKATRLLPPYLRQHYDADTLVLTVNKTNPAAIASYLKGGFQHTGQVYPLGQAGPQWVMRMALREQPKPEIPIVKQEPSGKT